MRVFAPLLFALLALSSGVIGQETSTPANVVCFQEIVGSAANYAAVSASIGAWAAKLQTALSLSGDVHQYVDWAQVPDRTGFENGCNGPYATVADVFVHIQTTSDNYDSVSAALEAFIAANPWTSQPDIACGARSVVTFLPGCGKVNPTSGPSRGGAGTGSPTEVPTPANVVCYQTIVGSAGTKAQVEASIAAWAGLLQTTLSLSGDVHQYVDWAVVPDRDSFENGCNGPYATVEDIFVHIQTTAAQYDQVSADLEAFIAAHPITGQPNIACAARSVTTFLPTCGKAGGTPNPTQGATSAPTQGATSAPTQAATSAPTQAATSAPTEAATSAPTEAATSAPTEAATSSPTEAATSAPTQAATSAPTEGPTRANSPTEASEGEQPSPNNILCYQEIIGSNSNLAAVDASVGAWAAKLLTALGLSGDVHQYVDWAQVPDRTGFENGCNGPYQTVADVFVHIETTSAAYDDLSAKLEAFISANPWPSQPNIACSARSVVTFLPGCGKLQTGPNILTTAPPTSGATQAPTSAPTQGATSAPTSGATQAPTSAPTSGATQAPTSAPTSGATQAPTSAPTSSPSSGPTEVPTPANVVCYQAIFGSNANFSAVSASIEAWAGKLQAALGLSGDIHAIVDWAQVPDRTSFEGCPGPYTTVADVFVHIQTTSAGYDALSLKLEAFVLANPLTAQPNIACAARSVTTFLPTCGKVPSGAAPPGGSGTVCYQSIVGSKSGTSAQVEAELSAWATKLQTTLGLSGDVHQYIDWAVVPDRNSFENGCDGPYDTVADIFVHIATTLANYDTVAANVESFVATNSLVSKASGGVIDCAARSVTTEIPICGKATVSSQAAAGSNTQTATSTSGAATATITGSLIITFIASLFALRN